MARSYRNRQAKLSFPVFDYNPQSLSKYTEKELRKEYSRLRTIANKRLNRLMESEFKDTQAVYRNAGLFIPLKGVRNESELKHLLVDVSKFILSEQSTVTGQANIVRRLAKTWSEDKGFANIHEGNVRSWVEFLDYVQSVEGYIYETNYLEEAFNNSELAQGKRDKEAINNAYEFYKSKTESYRNPANRS